MERSDVSDKRMRDETNQRYLDGHGITFDMVGPHELVRDPPPYREERFLPSPEPAPMPEGIVMAEQVVPNRIIMASDDDKIYNDMGILIYKGEIKDGKPHGIGIQYCQDSDLILYEGEFKDGYRDGNGTLYWYNGGNFSGGSDGDLNTGENTIFVGGFKRGLFDGNIKMILTDERHPDKEFIYQMGKKVKVGESNPVPEKGVLTQAAKKFDYKTKGWVMFKSPADMANRNSIANRKKVKHPPKNKSMLGIPLKKLGNDVNLIKHDKDVTKQGGLAWCPNERWCGNYSPTDITFTPDEFIKQVIYKPTEEELRGEWRCEIWVAPGASLTLIKEKMNEGFTIDFEDENDKREVEAMVGGSYRRRNTLRNSRKRNTCRKSRKRNTRHKSIKRNTRRKSRKREARR